MDQISKNIIWKTLEAITFIITAIIQFALIAKFMSASFVGEFTLVFNFTYLTQNLACLFGILSVLTRDLSQGGESTRHFSIAFVLQIVLSALILLSSVLIVNYFEYFKDLRTGILILVVCDCLKFPLILSQSFLQSRENMKAVALINIVAYVISTVCEYLAIILKLDPAYLYGAVGIQLIIQAILTIIVTRKDFKVDLKLVSLSGLKDFFLQVIPVSLMAIICLLYVRTDVFMIDYFCGRESVAHYGAAYTFLDYLMIVSNFMVAAIFPNFSKYIKDDFEQFKKLYKRIWIYFVKFLVPLAIMLALFSPWLLSNIYTADYTKASMSLSLLMAAAVIAWVNGPSGTIFLSYKKQNIYLMGSVISLFVNVIANLLLIPVMGIDGAALATLMTELALCSFCLWQIKKMAGYLPFIGE